MLQLIVFILAGGMPIIPTQQVTRETLSGAGASRSFVLYGPDSARHEGPRPLLILLHGSGRDGRSLVDPWKDLAQEEGIILAAPEATDKRQWELSADSPDLFEAVVEAVKGKREVDTRRIYLFGHSAGAVHAIAMGLLESEYFAAVAVHAGALPADSHDLIDYHDRKIPFAIWVGTHDRFFPVPLVEATRTAMEAKGLTVKVEILMNHTHDYYGRSRDINGAAWAFLKAHRLGLEPKFKQYR